jgi:magnesium-protoporphyrin IX monomethyl ester (oxidative) cyclase
MSTPVTPLGAPSPTGATAPLAQPGAILLVVPPFAMASRPVLSVSQMKTTLAAAGFSAKVLYLNLRFAERIGWDSFEWMSRRLYQHLFGEFIFSCVLFQRSKHDVQRYVDRVLGSLPPEEVVLPQYHSNLSTTEKLQHLVGEAAEFCREAGREILAHDPWIAGFTSSFHQNCASLSLIREIKERRPGVITAIGGANCEGEMGEELLVQFPLVDYVCQGECDLSFVELVRSIRAGCAEPVIPGVLIQGRGRQRSAPRPLTGDELDQLPYPDFSEYFAHLKVADPAKRVVPLLALETSRGCWWGAKHHCTF